MDASMTHPAPATHPIPGEVPGADRIRGRSRDELADALTFLAWWSPGTFRAVMDYMDALDGEFIPVGM
jgi:hypothetical protein